MCEGEHTVVCCCLLVQQYTDVFTIAMAAGYVGSNRVATERDSADVKDAKSTGSVRTTHPARTHKTVIDQLRSPGSRLLRHEPFTREIRIFKEQSTGTCLSKPSLTPMLTRGALSHGAVAAAVGSADVFWTGLSND